MSSADDKDSESSAHSDDECQSCRQPLEEWEAGICEGCGIMTSKLKICCDCNRTFAFFGSVNDVYKCPYCGLWNSAKSDQMKTMDTNDTLSFRSAISALWWRHSQIAESLEIAMQKIPICDSPSISEASAKAILCNIARRDTDAEESAVESYSQRFFS